MILNAKRSFDDLDYKLRIGNLELNILYIHFRHSDPSWVEKNHSHTGYELHYIPQGQGKLISGGREYRITPAAFYLTGPGVYHEQKTDPSNPMMEYCVSFDIRARKPAKNAGPADAEAEQLAQWLLSAKFWFGQDEYNSGYLFEQVYQELDVRQTGYYISSKNYIFQIILNMIRSYMGRVRATYPIPLKTLYENRINVLDNYLYYAYNQHASIDEIAGEMGVSCRQFQRIFKAYFHMSFQDKRNEIRMENAKLYLRTTDDTVENIAEKVGFSSVSHFIKLFHKLEGVTPKQYQLQNRRGGK